MQNLSDFIMKCAIFEEHSSSCVVYSRFGGTLFPVSIIDGDQVHSYMQAGMALGRPWRVSIALFRPQDKSV